MRLDGSIRGKASARHLRGKLTPPEIAQWLALRRNKAGLRFRRQHPAGDYVLDFYCAPARLAIEVDGEAHNRGDQPARDAVRSAWLATHGVEVLRFAAADVLHDGEAVLTQILSIAALRKRLFDKRGASAPSVSRRGRLPPPPGGGG